MYKYHKWNKALSSTVPSWPERRGYVQVRTPHRWNPRELASLSLQEASQIAPSAVAQMSNASHGVTKQCFGSLVPLGSKLNLTADMFISQFYSLAITYPQMCCSLDGK